MANNQEGERMQYLDREVVDLYNFRERSRDEIINDIASATPEQKIGIIQAYLRNIDETLVQSFDTGEWFQQITSLRSELQAHLDRLASLEFKIGELDAFFGKVKERLTERMRAAHDERGNDWLWTDMPGEAQEEWLDAAGYSILLLRKLQLGGAGQVGVQIGERQVQSEPGKTSVENKLTDFDQFMGMVRQRISEGDARFGDRWLVEDQPGQIQNEIMDTIGYAYFGWRKANMMRKPQGTNQETPRER